MKWLGWAGGAVALLVLLLLGIWMIDPPWRISEIEGLVVGAGNRIAPSVVAQYYKMHLLVKTEDGRNIGVFSERHVPPRSVRASPFRNGWACSARERSSRFLPSEPRQAR